MKFIVVLLVILFLSFIYCNDDYISLDGTPGNPLENKFQNENLHEENSNNDDKYLLRLENGGFSKNINDYNETKREELYQILYGWLGAEGVKATTSLSIKYIDDMDTYGLLTNKQLNDNEILITLPKHVMISTLPPQESDPDDIPFCDLTRRWPHLLLKKLFQKADDGHSNFSPSRMDSILLSLCLIHESKKSGGSFYQPYLNTIPVQLSQPLLWKESIIDQLQESPIKSAVFAAKKQLEQDYSILTDILFTHPSQGFTFEHYCWAMLTVSTRSTDVTIPGRKSKVKALVPILDMINIGEGYSLPSTEFEIIVKNEKIEFHVDTDIPANEQILLRNTVCENSLCYLLNHGYLPPSLPHDFIPLNILNKDHSLLYLPILEEYAPATALENDLIHIKSQILLQNQFSKIKLGIHYIDGIFTIFRILCANQEEIDKLIKVKSLSSAHSILSDKNERCTIQSIHELLESTLTSYPTSIQFDKLLFKRLPKDEKELKLAINMRIIEKTIITEIIEYLLKTYPTLL